MSPVPALLGMMSRVTKKTWQPVETVKIQWAAGSKPVKGGTKTTLKLAGSVGGKKAGVKLTATCPGRDAGAATIKVKTKVR